ncbi:hypothetical protein L1987_77875 [Smallanthus sonchifolius]|uniref:Uncharacterized protein n=1 Tax=Smallanthus sonchifolius TaxID=185202 RepID=A0ACB8ZC48_9ASTR|nr:hypothetical protein L1987_77875 [Smallanthus sonchifolius]
MAMIVRLRGGCRQIHSQRQQVNSVWCHSMRNGVSRQATREGNSSKVAAVVAHPGGDRRRAKVRKNPMGAAALVDTRRVGGEGVGRVMLDWGLGLTEKKEVIGVAVYGGRDGGREGGRCGLHRLRFVCT